MAVAPRWKLLGVLSAAVGSAALVIAQGANTLPAERYVTSTEWPTYGHDPGGMRYSPLTTITPWNVTTLGVAWVYHLKPEGYVARGGRGGTGFVAAEDTPLVVNGVMYIASPYGRVVALDAVTGKEDWVYVAADGPRQSGDARRRILRG